MIVEPVQRAILPEPGFLQGLRSLCDEVGACLVFDEIVTGFRLGLGGAQERYAVAPDLTTLGKIVGGGLPLAAVCGRAEIMRRAAPGSGDVYQSGTMNGHALAAAWGWRCCASPPGPPSRSSRPSVTTSAPALRGCSPVSPCRPR